MDTLLVLFVLAIKSSYSRNLEVAATDGEFDTVQFFFGGGDAWRIKTYALDQDVHVWNIGNVEDLVALARANTEKHYGDVLAQAYILRSDSGVEGIRPSSRIVASTPTWKCPAQGLCSGLQKALAIAPSRGPKNERA